ncbi:MAG: DMT family transporter, partial [Bacteroidota bacterium]
GTISMTLFFMAVKEIPFGSAVSLRYLSPIFAGVLAIILLRERITPLQWTCFIAAFFGVLILKGFDTRISLLGLGYILFSALFSGVVYVIIRKIGQREHPVVIITYFMICATAAGGLLSYFYWQTPSSTDWWVLGSLGIFGFFGQLFMTKAYQIASIGTVAPMKYIESVFALLFGWIWFGESYGLWSLLGIVLIVGGMLLNVFVKEKTEKIH